MSLVSNGTSPPLAITTRKKEKELGNSTKDCSGSKFDGLEIFQLKSFSVAVEVEP